MEKQLEFPSKRQERIDDYKSQRDWILNRQVTRVKDLIKQLQKCDPEAVIVHYGSDHAYQHYTGVRETMATMFVDQAEDFFYERFDEIEDPAQGAFPIKVAVIGVY